jgi:hypothetical protein
MLQRILEEFERANKLQDQEREGDTQRLLNWLEGRRASAQADGRRDNAQTPDKAPPAETEVLIPSRPGHGANREGDAGAIGDLQDLLIKTRRDARGGRTLALRPRREPCLCVMLKADMRDADIIETELMEISAMADDGVKLERIIAWCAVHPDEVPFALHQMMRRRNKHAAPPETPQQP